VFASDIPQFLKLFHSLNINGATSSYIILAADMPSTAKMIFALDKFLFVSMVKSDLKLMTNFPGSLMMVIE
jgi:hypothetical protein